MKGIPAFPCMPLFYRGMRCAGLAGICLFLLGACHTDTLYHVYQAVPGEKGWNKSDSLVFTLPPEVAAGTYGMEIGIRHTGGYPYRDIWLSVTQVEGEDSLASHTDTLHIYLADEKGAWEQHEGAIGGLYQRAYTCEKPVVWLTDSVGHSLRITHLMRQNPLSGVLDVGVRLFFTSRVNTEKDK